MTKKATKEITERRVREITDAVASGLPEMQIVPYFTKKWGLSERALRWYRAKYRAKLEKIGDYKLNRMVNVLIMRYESLYMASKQDGDNKNCTAVLNGLTRLLMDLARGNTVNINFGDANKEKDVIIYDIEKILNSEQKQTLLPILRKGFDTTRDGRLSSMDDTQTENQG